MRKPHFYASSLKLLPCLVSTTGNPENIGNLLEFEILPGNTGNLVEFN